MERGGGRLSGPGSAAGLRGGSTGAGEAVPDRRGAGGAMRARIAGGRLSVRAAPAVGAAGRRAAASAICAARARSVVLSAVASAKLPGGLGVARGGEPPELEERAGLLGAAGPLNQLFQGLPGLGGLSAGGDDLELLALGEDAGLRLAHGHLEQARGGVEIQRAHRRLRGGQGHAAARTHAVEITGEGVLEEGQGRLEALEGARRSAIPAPRGSGPTSAWRRESSRMPAPPPCTASSTSARRKACRATCSGSRRAGDPPTSSALTCASRGAPAPPPLYSRRFASSTASGQPGASLAARRARSSAAASSPMAVAACAASRRMAARLSAGAREQEARQSSSSERARALPAPGQLDPQLEHGLALGDRRHALEDVLGALEILRGDVGRRGPQAVVGLLVQGPGQIAEATQEHGRLLRSAEALLDVGEEAQRAHVVRHLAEDHLQLRGGVLQATKALLEHRGAAQVQHPPPLRAGGGGDPPAEQLGNGAVITALVGVLLELLQGALVAGRSRRERAW